MLTVYVAVAINPVPIDSNLQCDCENAIKTFLYYVEMQIAIVV